MGNLIFVGIWAALTAAAVGAKRKLQKGAYGKGHKRYTPFGTYKSGVKGSFKMYGKKKKKKKKR